VHADPARVRGNESRHDEAEVRRNATGCAGDTIVAAFDYGADGGHVSRPRIRELFANGNASSFYQIPVEQGTDGPAERQLRAGAERSP
jgi:hypothetical protein